MAHIIEQVNLKCCVCTDRALIKDEPGDIPDAFTIAPVVMPQGLAAIPVCLECRREQLAAPKSSLMIP